MAFLSDLRRFYGTGEKNPAGQSLEEFLEHYNPAKYESLCNTADIVVVRCEEKTDPLGTAIKGSYGKAQQSSKYRFLGDSRRLCRVERGHQ